VRQQGKERHPASKAVIDLREAMGMTQADFSRVIGRAETSVARYETSHPPRGIALLELAQIAGEQREQSKGPKALIFHMLQQHFLDMHRSEMAAQILGSSVAAPNVIRSYISTPLYGKAEIRLAGYFQTLLAALRSPLRDVRTRAQSALITIRGLAKDLEEHGFDAQIRERFAVDDVETIDESEPPFEF
jgi:transcriptional regulator with XRE-family HTH domain